MIHKAVFVAFASILNIFYLLSYSAHSKPLVIAISQQTPNAVAFAGLQKLIAFLSEAGLRTVDLEETFNSYAIYQEGAEAGGIALVGGEAGVTFLPRWTKYNGSRVLVLDGKAHTVVDSDVIDDLEEKNFTNGTFILNSSADTVIHEFLHAMIFVTDCFKGNVSKEEELVINLTGDIGIEVTIYLLLQSGNISLAKNINDKLVFDVAEKLLSNKKWGECYSNLGLPVPFDGTPVSFFDNFDRFDNANVGNGWMEVDGNNLNSFIQSDTLEMSQVGFLPADPNDGEDTRIYRVGMQHNNIIVSGTLNISMMSDSGGAQQVPRVVVRSNGTAGSGDPFNSPCGLNGTTPPDCWEGDGFGFQIFADRDASPNVRIQVVDDGVELAELTNFTFPQNTTYQWEMQINALNHVAVFIWTGAKPSVPTIEFTNGGNPYVPIASGDLWQIEVKNTNDNIGQSHAHSATWDDFLVMPID